VAPKPEDHRAFVPFMFLMLEFEPRDCCNKHLLVENTLMFVNRNIRCLFSTIVLFCLPIFLGEPGW
jgi:hypothetical protein